jgi:hypothetical protein
VIDLGGRGTLVARPAVAADESPRPYLHPLLDATGRTITDFRPSDHRWHHALSVAVPIVRVGSNSRPITFWGGPTFVRDHGYRDLGNHGSQVVVGEDGSTLELEWRDERGQVVLREAREHRVVDIDAQTWALGVTSTWRAESALRFGSPATEGRANAGYGGLFLRAAPRFTGATAMRADGALGQSEAMGADGRWCGLVKPGDGTIVMAVAPNSESPMGPWFVRSEPVPMLCFAPFFHDEWTLAAGGRVSWRWWVVSASGELDAASIDRIVDSLD